MVCLQLGTIQIHVHYTLLTAVNIVENHVTFVAAILFTLRLMSVCSG